MKFIDIFDSLPPENLCAQYNIFELVGKDFYAVTAGNPNHFNSMVGSGGGAGLFFRRPATICLFRSDRYTLELIQKEHKYTMSFFPNEHKEAMMFLGKLSGRNSNKMREVQLTPIQTSSGNMAYEEAGLVLECSVLMQTTIKPDDLLSQDAIYYTKDEYKDENGYRKIVVGEITHAWIKK